MLRSYRIVSGSFRRSDDEVATVGDVIELDDDVATVHAARLQLVPVESAEPAPSDQ